MAMLFFFCSGFVKRISFCLSLFTSQFDEHTDEGCYVIDNLTGTARILINVLGKYVESCIGGSKMDSETGAA
jgi:hypothetical protein